MPEVKLRAVALVKSPLQLMNAIEACQAWSIPTEECLLVLMADRKSLPQLAALIDRCPSWGGVIPLVNVSLRPSPGSGEELRFARHPVWGNDLFGIVKLRNLARRMDSLDAVFVGDLGNAMMRHFARLISANDVVVLDDGVATLQYAEWRYQGKWGKRLRWTKKVGYWFKRGLFGLRDDFPGHLVFFSVYDIPVRENDRLVTNKFSYLRSRAQHVVRDPAVYFLGGPLVEAGILSEDDYLWHLERVAERLEGKRVVYVVHRRENVDRVTRISKSLGWETCLFEYPIEFQLAVVGPLPELLMSFISSALENCRTLFGTMLKISSYRFHAGHFALNGTPRGEGIYALYARYEEQADEYFQVVDLS